MPGAAERMFAEQQALQAGMGFPRILPGNAPGAGGEVSFTVPGPDILLLRSFLVGFVTSAVAVSRRIVLSVDDGSTVIGRYPIGSVLGPTTTRTLEWLANYGDGIGFPSVQIEAWPSPPMYLYPGWRLRTLTAAIDAGDQYGVPRLYVLAAPDWRYIEEVA